MAIISCPECSEKISDTVNSCIHCGCKITHCTECGEISVGEYDSCPNCGFVFKTVKITKEQVEKEDDVQDTRSLHNKWKKESAIRSAYDSSIVSLLLFILASIFVILAFKNILDNIPITIRPDELIVGSATVSPRSCQVFPEFSYEWLEAEFDTVATRSADPFYISEQTKNTLRAVYKYWKGKTTSELATSMIAPEARLAMKHNVFTPGNYFYNGVGHVTVQYDKVLAIGYRGIIAEVEAEKKAMNFGDGDYCAKPALLDGIIMSCEAVINYAERYATLAERMAKNESNATRREELFRIADNCRRVPANGAQSFYEACQSFWFVQMLLQVESSGHSISPGRFDQYMYPYY